MLFDWDDANRNHIARHGVTPEDCEEAIAQELLTVPEPDRTDEARWKTIGHVKDRRLDVIWTLRGERRRVVTAYWRHRK